MKVYYGENFWGSGKPGTEMEEIRLNQEFIWEDISGFIPAVYVCSAGIAVDFCIRISNEAVQGFWDKWQSGLGKELGREEREQIARENPLDVDFNVAVSVNDVPLENDFGCGAGYTRMFHDNMKDSLEEQLFLEYHCDEQYSWHFKRHMCRWPEQPLQIETMTIDFLAEDKPFECDAIEIGLGDAGKEFTVVHPISGEPYRLFVEGVEQQELSEEVLEEMGRRSGLEYPGHYLMLSYHIEPQLPENAFLLQGAGKGEEPRGLQPRQAAGISVIGGADGPTSIFIAGKCDRRKEKIAANALHFHPVERGLWKPVFMVKERGDMRLCIRR